MKIEGKGHFFTYVYFPAFICFVLTRPRYQVSVYRTIGPLVSNCCLWVKHSLIICRDYAVLLTFNLHKQKDVYMNVCKPVVLNVMACLH